VVIIKPLHGLRASGARFHEKFADALLAMQFLPCKADPDVWMKECGAHCECACVCVDDLAAMMKDPSTFFAGLRGRKCKLKGVGEMSCHLGGDFYRDPDDTLTWGAKTHCKRIVNQCKSVFCAPPKECTSPVDKDDHLELDVTEEAGLKTSKTAKASSDLSNGQSLLAGATMSVGRLRATPKVGHLNRLNRVRGCLKKCPDGATRFRTKIPDCSHLDHLTCDWACSVHAGDSKEEVPPDMPILRGMPVRTTTFEDANLMQDLTTGRSVTDVLHLVNSTPIDWHCKSQRTRVETATCGSEFVAARLATKQIMDLQCTLLHLMAKLACSVTMKVSSLVPLFGIHP
jgi:hypothetical protein